MKKEKSQKVLLSGIAMVVLFILWTVAISLIDVQPIGPQNSSVGFATLNGFIHSLTGVHMAIYTVTDWLGLIKSWLRLGSVQRPHNGEYQTRQAHRLAFVCVPI